MVTFLYRPEYYDITADEFGESNKGETHVRIAKHRNGSLEETIKLRALLHIQKFIDDEGIGFQRAPSGRQLETRATGRTGRCQVIYPGRK